MDRHPLLAHPAAPPAADWRLDAQATGGIQGLELRYRLQGDIARLRLGCDRGRQDGLWRQTCFEAFCQPAGAPGYLELNFAPSGAWAGYRFDARRSGMRPLAMPAPRIAAVGRDHGLEVTVQFQLPSAGAWRLGLAAVLEDDSGAMSYWALSHAGPQPDFHDPAGFLLDIAAA